MHEVKMPKFGSAESGSVIEWRVAAGDAVREGQTLADVATEKVNVELESPASGTVTQILVVPGEEVSVGTVILVIDEQGR